MNQIKNNSKTKNRKIDYSFVSEHCAVIWTKKNGKGSFCLFEGGGGVGVFLTKNTFFLWSTFMRGYFIAPNVSPSLYNVYILGNVHVAIVAMTVAVIHFSVWILLQNIWRYNEPI